MVLGAPALARKAANITLNVLANNELLTIVENELTPLSAIKQRISEKFQLNYKQFKFMINNETIEDEDQSIG
jgi:hypothetical protein